MDSSPNYGLSPIPNGCVGCNWLDEVKVLHRVTTHRPGGAMIDTPPTTPQVTTPQALLAKEEAALPLLRPTTVASCLLPGTTSSAPLFR